MKKYLILLAAVALFLGVWFAGNESSQPNQEKLPINGVPERVVCINPAATEIIFELGCEDKLIAVSDFCNYPELARSLEKIGGVVTQNFERISMLKPDLVIFQGAGKDTMEFCQARGIQCVSINLRSVDEVYGGVKQLGDILGVEEEALEVCERISGQFDEIAKKLSGAEKEKVFFSFFRTPGSLAGITTVGPDTCLSELITIAGGVNIFSDLKQDYTVISKESLLKRQPDIIIEPYSVSIDHESNASQAIKDWSKLGALNAVENGRIHFVDPDLVLKPGPRVGLAALTLAKLLHPELFIE